MVREIVKDPVLLMQKSSAATEEDLVVAQDLIDTLLANRDRCVGLAANMIGVLRRVIVVDDEGTPLAMLNPEFLQTKGQYETEEGCLSLTGVRKTKRYEYVKVRYQNMELQTRIRTFRGWTAQIIQHEVDHCNGILI